MLHIRLISSAIVIAAVSPSQLGCRFPCRISDSRDVTRRSNDDLISFANCYLKYKNLSQVRGAGTQATLPDLASSTIRPLSRDGATQLLRPRRELLKMKRQYFARVTAV